MNKYKFSFNVFTGNFDLVLSQIDIINVIGGTPLTVAGFDAAGVFESIPSWNISATTGGLYQNIAYAPADTVGGTTDFINNVQVDITPSNNLVNLNLQGLQNYAGLHGPNDFANYIGLNNSISTFGTGSKGSIAVLQQGLVLGDGANAMTSAGANVINNVIDVNSGMTLSQGITSVNSNINVHAGSSAQYVAVQSGFVNLDEQITGNIQLDSMQANINVSQPVGVGLNYVNYGGNISGTIQYVNGVNFGPQVQSGGAVTNSFQAYLDNTHVFSGASLLGGYTSYGASINLDSGSTFTGGGLTSFNANPNVAADLSTTGYAGFSTGGQFSSTIQYFNAVGSFASLNSGASVTNGYNAFTENSNFQSGSSINFYSGMGIFPNFHAGSVITGQLQGLSVNAAVDITVPQVTLAQLSINGSGTTPQLTGLQINLNGMSSTAQKQGITVNDGNISVNASYDTGILPPSPGFLSMNNLGGLYHVASGFPVTNTLLLANDLGVSFEFEDDVGPDAFFGILGMVNVGFLNQLAVATGKTVDTVTELLIAASVPSLAVTGGTVTNANMITAAGVVSGGGTVNITNLRGLWIPPIFNSFSASNAWGVIVEDTTADNWFSKNVIVDGTTGKPSNSSIGIELQGTTKAFRNSVLTTTEETALTPLAGMQVFNSTTGNLDFYDGTTWNPLGPGVFANTFLSNLTSPTAINQDLLPGSDATLNLGSGSKRWSNLSTVAISSSGATAIDVNSRRLMYSDGTTPVVNWTTGIIRDSSNNQSIDWFGRNLRDAGGSQSLDWDNRQLVNSLGGIVLDYNLGVVNVNTHKITNVVDPTAAQDAATKNYVDTFTSPLYLQVANNLSDVASATTSFDNISPMTTGGDIIYGGASGTGTRLPNGSAGQVLTSAGGTSAPSWTTIGGGGGSTTYKAIFTSSGTWTVPVTVTPTTIVKITSVGAGGGGATGTSGGLGGGGGGGAGATCVQWIDGTTLGATVAITVGVGGAPGVGSSSNGVNGGNTVFGAFHTAGGGVGGAGNAVTTGGNGGTGGVPTGGDININGGGAQSGGGGIAATLGGVGGVGGSSSLGGGGGVSNSGTSFNGFMGGGGGGNGGGAGDGGAGGSGIVILEWIG